MIYFLVHAFMTLVCLFLAALFVMYDHWIFALMHLFFMVVFASDMAIKR